MAARRDQNSAASAVAEHLDDLRAQLSAELRNTPDSEITQRWVAWDAARHAHPVSWLTDSLGVPRVIAVRLVTLAGHLPAHGGA